MHDDDERRMPAEPGGPGSRGLLVAMRVLWVLAGASVAGPLIGGALPVEIPIWITTLPTLLALAAMATWWLWMRAARHSSHDDR